ncbi:MAG TPA: carboxypeptidase regulatory-like domain-containing protein [Bryobacteraceae bacterium]|nr:carboxypeptidase regulatory-like domain-containing protein [Bryobacteraceae bacterium]
MRQRLVTLLLLCTLVLVVSVPGFSQSAAGVAGISGVVRDPSGAVVPNAKVEVSSEGLGSLRTLNTNEAGVFTAPVLTPGSGYKVTVTASGFATYEVKDITLQVGENLDLKVGLTVAVSTTQVEVAGAPPLVEDTKTDLSQVVNSRQIVDLPINGRRVDSFVLLTPGVTNDGTFGLLTFRGVANGNTFLLDGNDNTEQFFVENAGRTRVFSQIPQDAVQEFQVVSANFSAEYGKAAGGVVNTVTRSGTNQVHGSGYWFYRNDSMEAHDPYASVIGPDSRTQVGGRIGGAIIKDKLFYFVNAEFTRRNDPLADTVVKSGVVDSVNQVWSGCGTGSGTLPTAAQCSAINALLPRFFGLFPRTVRQDQAFGRFDYHLSDRNTFSGDLNFMFFRTPNGLQNTIAASTTGQAVNSNGNDYGHVKNGRLGWTAVPTNTLVNEFRFGWMNDLEGDDPNLSLVGPLGLLDVSVAGQQIGPINYLPRVEPRERRIEFADNVSWTKSTHTIKAGIDIADSEDYSYFIQNRNGSYSYSTVNAFALDYSGNTSGAKDWNSYSQAFGDPTVDRSIRDYGMYVQDQWRALPKLTVNYGLRYEFASLPQPTVFNQNYPQTGHINSPKNEVMPRIGLAYQLDPKTVIRAGYGIFYSRVAGATLQDLFTNNSVVVPSYSLAATQAPQKAAGPVFPNVLPAVPAISGLAALSFQFAAPNWKIPYSEQGTFAVEHQFAADLAATVSYIWSRGVQLYSERDLNLPPLGSTTFTYAIDNASGTQIGSYTTPVYTGTRPDSRYGGIYQDENGVTSSYNALAVQLHKTYAHGLQADLSYTWSHEIDDGQGYGQATQNFFLSNANAWLYNGNYKADKGNGLEDQRHRFVLSWVWEPTFTKRSGAFYKYVVNNWQLSSITTINSARPYTSPTVRVTDTPVPGMFSNFNLDGSGLSGRVPFWPVNSVYQPNMWRSDARISKLIPFGDRYRVSAFFEVFNISNSWSPTSMTSQAFTEAKGVLTLTPAAYGVGSGDSLNPDGTEARRMQVGLRFEF